MQIAFSPQELKNFAKTLTEKRTRIITTECPSGGYIARFADKHLGIGDDSSRYIVEIKSKDSKDFQYNPTGKGDKPKDAIIALINRLPRGEGTVELHDPMHWEDLTPHKIIDYKI